MIAKVRIAPVERWCPQNLEDLRRYPMGRKLVGIEVEILTETMQQIGDCIVRNKRGDGRVWLVTPKSRKAISSVIRAEVDADLMLCEHMLELD